MNTVTFAIIFTVSVYMSIAVNAYPIQPRKNKYARMTHGMTIDNLGRNNKHFIVKAVTFTAVGTCPLRDPASPVYLPDSEKCDIYYECSNGLPIRKDCPPGLEFNPVGNICDFPLDAGCKAGSNTTVVEAVTFAAVGTCPERDPATPVYFPDSEKCDIYYECSNGLPIQKDCPPGLEFNPDRNVCDFPLDAGCKVGNNRTVFEAVIFTAVGTCPVRDPATPVYLPDSEKCDIYYECSNGLPIQKDCPPGLEFNPVSNICDFPLDAGCKAGSNTTVVEAITFTAVGTCPERDPASPVYLPDSEKCDIYYECSNGLPIQKDCPPGLEFNPLRNVCDFPLDAGCKAGF